MKVNNTFHVSMVKSYMKVIITRDVTANHDWEMTRTEGGEETIEWKFERTLDHGKGDNGGWMYLVNHLGMLLSHPTPSFSIY